MGKVGKKRKVKPPMGRLKKTGKAREKSRKKRETFGSATAAFGSVLI